MFIEVIDFTVMEILSAISLHLLASHFVQYRLHDVWIRELTHYFFIASNHICIFLILFHILHNGGSLSLVRRNCMTFNLLGHEYSLFLLKILNIVILEIIVELLRDLFLISRWLLRILQRLSLVHVVISLVIRRDLWDLATLKPSLDIVVDRVLLLSR